MAISTNLKKSDILPYRTQIIEWIRGKHIRTNSGHDGPVFLVSTTYPGYWLEHLYDPIAWAKLFPEDIPLAVSHMEMFFENQRDDGKMPNTILDNDLMNSIPGRARLYTGLDVCPPGLTVYHDQLQECVSVGSLCLELWEMDKTLDLRRYYDRCCKWDEWLCRNRMTRGMGLVEVFGGYDTGHDNSSRFAGLKYPHELCTIPGEYPEGYPVDCDAAPLICPDVNAVFYGNRAALSKMAGILGLTAESAMWLEKAEDVKRRLIDVCFDEDECFFFDVDKHDRKIPVKSISVTTLYCEHMLDGGMADEIYRRYLSNPSEFGTPYPFPGVSVSDPTWKRKMSGNDWGYYSQGNVALRTLRWMKDYGREEELHRMMEKWIGAWCRPDILHFGQELHPITGEPSTASEWYSTTMVYLLSAMHELGLDE